MSKFARIAVLAMAVLAIAPGCHHRSYTPPLTSEHVSSNDLAEREGQLRDLVQRRKIQEAHSREENQQEVKRKSPYFFKEYATYPDDSEPKIEIQESDSRSAPLKATVEVAKIRYATRLHNDYDEATRDTVFIRDTGHEHQEYALRNGRWISLGDTFVAEKSEEPVNGQWVPVKEEEAATVKPSDAASEGWFKRTWKKISGS